MHKDKTTQHIPTSRENSKEHKWCILSLSSVQSSLCLRIQIGSEWKILFSVPIVLYHIVSISPIIQSSIVCRYHNLFYYCVPFGYLGCFKFFTLMNNAGYLFVNEYLIVPYIFDQREA